MERILIALAVILILFTSCVSCFKTIRQIIVLPAGVQQKYHQSIAVVRSSDGPRGNAQIQGTAFAIDESYLLSAGHVCEKVQFNQKLGMAGAHVKLGQVGPDGLPWDEVHGFISAVHSSADICLIVAPDHPFVPLILSENLDLVETEDPIVIVGAPAGTFPVRVNGTVSQVLAIDHVEAWPDMDPILLKVDIQGGNSGSPVMWGGEVIGMVVILLHRPNNMALAVSIDVLHKFIEDNTN